MERIKFSEFVEDYERAENDEKLDVIKSIMKPEKYVPLLNKTAMISMMLDKAVDEEYGIPKIDRVVVHINFNIALIYLYTNLSPDETKDPSKRVFEGYDTLQKHGLFFHIINQIGELEYSECCMIRDSILESKRDETTMAYQIAKYSSLLSSLSDNLKSLQDEIEDLDEASDTKAKK